MTEPPASSYPRPTLAAQHTTSAVLGRRPGSLVIVGSGIKAIGQFTLEARAHVRRADVVYYNVIDPATARWIVEQNPRALDLSTLYGDDKPRWITYVQMAELMLRSVREGADVVGVFYGHPGVFVYASHRAIAIARREGHVAAMLPAVSAIDCLFADLGVDPSRPGCQVVGATDLLLRRRPLLTESNVVILQVGVVGDLKFQLAGEPANDGLPVLVRYLQDAYGDDDYPVVNYIASELPTVEPTIDRLTLSRLLEPEARQRVNEASTFYLPPRSPRPVDAGMAAELGLDAGEAAAAMDPSHASRARYGRRELDAVAELETHRASPGHRPARPSPALFALIRDLALEPRLLDRYDADPELLLRSRPELSEVERAALLSGDRRWLRAAMERSSREVARLLVRRVLSDAALARRYHDLVGAEGGEEAVGRGLADLGYDTTPADLSQAFEELIGGDLGIWSARYELAVDGVRRGALTIAPAGEVLLDDAPVAGHRFEGGVLTWSEAAGNASSGVLRALVLTDVDGLPLPPGAYVGPQLRGRMWTAGEPAPERDNAFGKVGVYGADCIADPFAAEPAAAWAGVYATRLMTPQGRWRPGPELDLRPSAAGVDLLVDGQPAGDVAYAAGLLSWSAAEPSLSGSVLLHRHGGARLVGRLWQGCGQRSPAINCVGRRTSDG